MKLEFYNQRTKKIKQREREREIERERERYGVIKNEGLY